MKMDKIFTVLALLLVTALLIQGCAKEPVPTEVPEEPTEVDEDLLDIENLEEELSMDELENLDKEFEEINW